MATSASPLQVPVKNPMTDGGGIVSGIWERFFAALKKFTETRWQDVNIGGASLTKAAANQPSLVGIDGGSVLTYAFSGTSGTNELHGSFDLPHGYIEGSTIVPHVHWYPTTADAGDVHWMIDYVIKDDAETFTGTITATDSAPGVAWQQVFSEFDEVSIPTLKISSQIHLRLYRTVTNPADTYAANAAIGTLGIHYQADFMGSILKFLK